VIGAAGEKVNSVLVPVPRAIALIVKAVVPEFTICVVSAADPPAVTVPKFSEVGFSVIADAAAGPQSGSLASYRPSPSLSKPKRPNLFSFLGAAAVLQESPGI
jgi:hypothetical protein